MTVETWTPEETFEVGRQLGEQAKPGMVCCLNGDLGVGKTIFTQGFARGLGITETVNSPTFTIVQNYDGISHFDLYRINDASELVEIGLPYAIANDITLIEWPDIAADILPAYTIHIYLTENGAGRKLVVK